MYLELIKGKPAFSLGMDTNPSSRAMYEKGNRIIEKSSKIIYFAAIKLGVPGFLLPKAILSYFTYFSTDAGSEAFELPLPAWFV